jgi:hypothetical protein
VSQQNDKTNINSGGRALASVIRPYPYKIPGKPTRSYFNKDNAEYVLEFNNDESIQEPAEIFVPEFHFGEDYEVLFTNGKIEKDLMSDLLLYYPSGKGEHQLIVRKPK